MLVLPLGIKQCSWLTTLAPKAQSWQSKKIKKGSNLCTKEFPPSKSKIFNSLIKAFSILMLMINNIKMSDISVVILPVLGQEC